MPPVHRRLPSKSPGRHDRGPVALPEGLEYNECEGIRPVRLQCLQEGMPQQGWHQAEGSKALIEDVKFYWKPLSELIEKKHYPELKSNGSIGQLKRKHVLIDKASIYYLGKESNELEESEMIGIDTNSYTKYTDIESLALKLLSIPPKEAQRRGISKSEYYDILNKYTNGKQIRLKKATIERLKAI